MQSNFENVIRLQLDKYKPENAKKIHIAKARAGLRQYLATQEVKPNYRIFVDGRVATSEDNVKPFGVIEYRFIRMQEIGKMAIEAARALSPVQSGRYKKSWFLLADGKQVSEDTIPADTEQLMLSNDVPYARKIQLRGARFRLVEPGIVDRIKQRVLSRYRSVVSARMEYVTLGGGYVLQRDYVQKQKGGRTRLHTKRGAELRYPALFITSKT